MNRHLLIPDLASKIEIAQECELKLAGIYADIAKNMTDPTLQSLIYSLSGDAYGHFRTLAIIQTLTESRDKRHTSPTEMQPYPTAHLSHPSMRKSSFRVRTMTAGNSGKGGESNGNELSSMQ
ncbi:MAG: hypothetical protein GX331_10295 [Firmicutes bacterium]|jgi:hypothetical protein|nr:hypothetical protein [Bacillota bacterium]